VAAFDLAASVGITQAAARLGLSPRSLRAAFDRWQLGRPSAYAGTPKGERDEAARAFVLAEQVGLREAARQLGTNTSALYRAFDRWGLGRPDSSGSAARWARQLGSDDRQRVWREADRQHFAVEHARRDAWAAGRRKAKRIKPRRLKAPADAATTARGDAA